MIAPLVAVLGMLSDTLIRISFGASIATVGSTWEVRIPVWGTELANGVAGAGEDRIVCFDISVSFFSRTDYTFFGGVD